MGKLNNCLNVSKERNEETEIRSEEIIQSAEKARKGIYKRKLGDTFSLLT